MSRELISETPCILQYNKIREQLHKCVEFIEKIRAYDKSDKSYWDIFDLMQYEAEELLKQLEEIK